MQVDNILRILRLEAMISKRHGEILDSMTMTSQNISFGVQIYLSICRYIDLYMYREREMGGGDRDRERDRERDRWR